MPVITIVAYILAGLSFLTGGWLLFALRAAASGLPTTAEQAVAAFGPGSVLGPASIAFGVAFLAWTMGFICHRIQQIRDAIRDEYAVSL